MENRKLEIITEPVEGTRSVVVLAEDKKIIGKDGSLNLLCGKCGEILAENINEGQVSNVVLKCFCGAYNDVP